MKNKIIKLMDDQSIQLKKTIKYDKDCKYFLIPFEDVNETFIMVPLTKFMKKYTHATLSYSMVIVRHNEFNEDNETHKYLETVSNNYTDLVNFIIGLHSLNRIRYCNILSNSNESFQYDLLEFTQFKLNIFHNENILFEYEFNGDGYNKLGPENILEKIQSIYNPVSTHLKNKYLLVNDTCWMISKTYSQIDECTFVGVPLESTNSISFFPSQYLKILSDINSLYSANVLYNDLYQLNYDLDTFIEEQNELLCEDNLDEVGYRFNDVWNHYINDIIEYLSYLPIIYATLITTASLNDLHSDESKIIMNTMMLFDVYTNYNGRVEMKIEFNNDSIITMKEIIYYLSDIIERKEHINERVVITSEQRIDY